MNLLILDPQELGLAFALKCQDAGHEVRLWIPRSTTGTESPVGQGLVERPPKWQPLMGWADLVVLTANDKYAAELEPFFKRGFPILGANQKGAELELDREKGQNAFEACGIETAPFEIFTDLSAAAAYVQKTDGSFVCKPWGGTQDKSLSYVPPKGYETEGMAFHLERCIRRGLKGTFMLQEKIEGIEMGVSGWFGPGGWSEAIEEDFEEKKFMNEGWGCNCYSSDTEVLTKRGWITFDKVTMQDEVASYEPKTGTIFFEKPVKLHWTDYEGPMVHFQNRYVDLLVTPNHKMWAARRKTDDWDFYEASNCPSEFNIRQTAETTAEDWGETVIPGFAEATDVKLDSDDWFAFLGLYLSEGHVGDRGRIYIAQQPGYKRDLMRKILAKLPWRFVEYTRGFYTTAKLLAISLLPFGHSIDKFVPDYIKAASKRQINLFLDAFCLGDGDIHEGRRRFHSGSYQLISDLQELFLRIGKAGVISEDKRRTMLNPINGKTYACLAVYSLEESDRSTIGLRSGTVETYSGKIGCVTLQTTHIIFVRRNQRVAVCGQTGEQGTTLRFVKKSKLFEAVLRPLTEYLHGLGYLGNLNVNCIIDVEGKPWPLEFTARLGWPAFNIMLPLVEGDPCEWMLDLIGGRDTLELSDSVAVGVVMTHCDFPWSKQTQEETKGFPIWGLRESDRSNVHFQHVMRGGKDSPWHTAGDYVMVVTGTGESVRVAAKGAYALAERLKWPSNIQLRTDIGERLKRELPVLQAKGFATGMEY